MPTAVGKCGSRHGGERRRVHISDHKQQAERALKPGWVLGNPKSVLGGISSLKTTPPSSWFTVTNCRPSIQSPETYGRIPIRTTTPCLIAFSPSTPSFPSTVPPSFMSYRCTLKKNLDSTYEKKYMIFVHLAYFALHSNSWFQAFFWKWYNFTLHYSWMKLCWTYTSSSTHLSTEEHFAYFYTLATVHSVAINTDGQVSPWLIHTDVQVSLW